MIRQLTFATLGLALLAGCEKKAEETVPVPVAAPTPATTAQQEEAAGQEVDDGLKLQQDFEEQAHEQVTAENLEQELDKVEKEIKEAEKELAAAPVAGKVSSAPGAALPKSAAP